MTISTIKLNTLTDTFYTQYNELLDSTISAHKINLREIWLRNYIKYYIKDKELSVIAVFQDDTLIGCLPMYVEKVKATRFWDYKVLKIIGCGPTDFFDILAEAGREVEVLVHIFQFLQKNKFWDKFELTEMSISSIIYELLPAILDNIGIAFKMDYPNGFHYINTKKGTWADYEIIFNQNNKDLQKSERRIKADEINLKILKHHVDIYSKLIHNIDLYAARRASLNQKNTYDTQERNLFLESIIGEKEKTNEVELTQLVDDQGVVWAFQLDWIDNKIRYHWNHAYNEDFKRYSPGKLLLKEIMRQSFENPKIRECNYMRGLSDYKNKLVDQKTMYFRIVFENPKSIKLKFTKRISALLKKLK
jgi:CelD/BcsL family acetyltransferase involved in cellulose biosynthesis